MTEHRGMQRVAVVGHSHLAALEKATREDPSAGAGLSFLQLRDDRYRPVIVRKPRWGGRRVVLNRRLRRDVARAVGRGGVLVSCVGGNDHNVLGLLNHPRPFDFVLASHPGLTPRDDRDLIPAGLMREVLHRRLAAIDLTLLHALKAATDAPMYHLESPPPVPSEDYIRRFPGVFRGRIGEFGVSPASLRYKMWRLQSEIVQRTCADIGITFVPAPAEARDDAGFLREQGWNPDPTHGNAWYGACVLRQIASIGAGSGSSQGAVA